jgi:glucokinase
MSNQTEQMVLTLDAGGTTFSFSSVNHLLEISEPLVLSAEATNLPRCLEQIVFGFETIQKKMDQQPSAISFAFPGPADYTHGVIGDLGNLPAFRGGVPLASFLENHFQVPVFINNDGNLFAYGEARAGFLDQVNRQLRNLGETRQYKNLLGITIGTGFGAGIVINGKMIVGDTSAAGEIWLLRQKNNSNLNVEEAVSIRGIRRNYQQLTGLSDDLIPSPKDLFLIAEGQMTGNQWAAKKSFEQMGEVLGDALANAVTLIDGAMVIGGGLSGAAKFFMPAVMSELNGRIGDHVRLESTVYYLEDSNQQELFYKNNDISLEFSGLKKPVTYSSKKCLPIGISQLGTSRAVALGAYYYVMDQLSN